MQTCNFCKNPESILKRETCCTGCSKISDAYQPERSKREDVVMIQYDLPKNFILKDDVVVNLRCGALNPMET